MLTTSGQRDLVIGYGYNRVSPSSGAYSRAASPYRRDERRKLLKI